MHRPRKTAELAMDFETPKTNTKSGNRCSASRIGILKRPSTRERPTNRAFSADRAMSTGTNKSFLSPSRQRSSSWQRTPIGSKATTLKVPLTAEKQRGPVSDKNWIKEHTMKIVDYLKTVDIGLGKDFVTRSNGLKSISTKNFIMIVNHLLKFICGNRFTINDNHPEELSKVLDNLNYPYTVAKSWLKTPNAPHAIGNVILLFNWLLSFNPEYNNVDSFQKEFQIMNKEFPNFEIQKDFCQMTQTSYDLWNNHKNAEFEMMKKLSIDKLIECNYTGLAGGIEEIDNKIKQLQSELKILNNNKIVLENEDKFLSLPKDVSKMMAIFENKEKLYLKNKKILSEMHNRFLYEQHQIKELEMMIKQIENMVKEQKYPMELRNQLIEDVDKLNHFLSTKMQSVEELKKKGEKIQISLSRIIKRVTVSISKFNNFIRELFTICHNDLLKEYTMESLLLNEKLESELMQQIIDISNKLQRIYQKCSQFRDIYLVEISELERELKTVTYKNQNVLKVKYDKLVKSHIDIENMLDSANHQMLEIDTEYTTKMDQVSGDLALAKEINSNLQSQLKQRDKDVKDARDLNKAMLVRVDEKMKEVREYRSERHKLFNEAIKMVAEQVDNYELKWMQKDWTQFFDE